MSDLPTTYFTCTLEQATSLNDQTQPQAKTISDFLKSQARLYPRCSAAGFPHPREGKLDFDVFSFETIYKGAVLAAQEFSSLIRIGDEENSTCVALLCPSSVEFLFAWLGLMQLGYSVLLIAPQCQPAAIASLCKSCSASIIFHDSSYHSLAFVSASQEGASISAKALPWQARNQSITTIIQTTEPDFDLVPQRSISENDVAYIHHSSGTSTGTPKPIPQSHRAGMGVLPRLDGREKATFTTTPLYHGGIADCFRAWTSNAMIWLFPGGDLPITPKHILACLDAASRAESDIKTPPVRYFSSVPYVLQMLCKDTSGLYLLQDMDLVGVGGAVLPPKVGDKLVQEDVNLVSRFGSAECGFLLSSHRDYTTDEDWQYLRLPSSCTSLSFEKVDSGSELRELIVKTGWPHMAKTNRPDGSYATSDLFEPHPKIKNAWRYHSRNDSQITLLTGKKFDPAPLEDAICSSSKAIRDVVIFGNGRQYPGALIFISRNTTEAEGDIWDVLSKANDDFEPHSRIERNMVILLGADEPAPEKSSKGTILRGPTEQRFSEDIDKLYFGLLNIAPPSKTTVIDSEVASVVKSIVHGILGCKLSDQADFYQHGIDSTRATQIRSKIQAEIPIGMELPWNVVYDQGNIQELSKFLIRARKGEAGEEDSDMQEMLKLVEKYSSFDTPPESKEDIVSQSKVVLLTGATGALGANIINFLCKNTSVSKILCLVRAKDEAESEARVEASLAARKISASDTERSKIQCIPFHLDKPDLGLSTDTLGQIKSQATSFIHAAWAVNFSLPLRSFVREHVAGLHHLLNLTISCERLPNFTFCSSTASVIRSASSIREKLSNCPEDADSLGYSRSKWIAEAICASASGITSMEGRIKVVRVGQLTGDTKNGFWNMSEAWPLMLSTVRELKCLPQIQQNLDWLPLDVAAEAVVDISFADTLPKKLVYHVLNNHGDSVWNDLLGWLQDFETEKFETVDPSVWLEKLGATKDHPAKRLSWLWEKAYRIDEGVEEKNVIFSTENGTKASSALGRFAGMDKELFRKIWLWIKNETALQAKAI